MTTRDKLAIAMALAPEYGPEHTLDALEAIVQEARDEAIEECAVRIEPKENSTLNTRVQLAFAQGVIRAIKKAKP